MSRNLDLMPVAFVDLGVGSIDERRLPLPETLTVRARSQRTPPGTFDAVAEVLTDASWPLAAELARIYVEALGDPFRQWWRVDVLAVLPDDPEPYPLARVTASGVWFDRETCTLFDFDPDPRMFSPKEPPCPQ